MKNFKTFFKTQLFLAVVLLSANFGFAQVVQVPANCRVVVAGTGGTLGFGPTGKVGQGGMVAMPDILLVSPFTINQGGSFTFIPPVVVPAVTTASWSLLGDLSNTTVSNTVSGVTGNFNGATNPPSGLSATILSYNRRYRTSEGVAPSNPSWARSNGQVRVSWTGAGCGSSITFNVYKNFNPTTNLLVSPFTPVAAVPIIVGPDCLKPNTQYTYSVDQIVSDNTDDAIGFDSYYWSGLPGAWINLPTTYTSADRSSITFTTPANFTGITFPFTISCCYGRVNPNTADGGPFTAINQTVTPTRTTCVTKSLLIAPLAPNYQKAPPICVPVGAPAPAASVTFDIIYPNVPAGQTYTWTAPNTGWTGLTTPLVNTPVGNTTLTVDTSYNNNPGLLTLTITGNGCDPAIFNYQINRSLAATTTITPVSPSTACIAGTSSNTYTINASAVGVTLAWSTVPATITGITLTPSANTNSVTVTAAGAAPGSFTLQAQGTSPCSTPVVTTTINVQPATPIFTTGTPSCVAKGTTGITSIAINTTGGLPTTGYTWDLSLAPGWSITANGTTSNPTFTAGTGAGPVTIKARLDGTNSCNSAQVSKIINYIAVSTSFPGGGFPDQYLVSGACGTVTSWVIGTASGTTTYTATSGNVSVTSIGGGTNNVLGISGSAGLAITSVCANLPGPIQVCASTVGSLTQRLANNPINGEIKNVIISPNPNNGNFTINVAGFNESASATLTDFSGNEIQTFKLRKGDNKIEKEGLQSGTYFVVLRVDGKQEARQIIIK